jgi:3-hydroxyacyl-[acyl-carrier-protein] dehydratase
MRLRVPEGAMRNGANLVALLPHVGQMRLLNRAEMTAGDVLVSEQSIPIATPVLDGHFPGFPIWPGALLLEAMAQTTAVWLLSVRGGLDVCEIPLLGAVECRFFRPVRPGALVIFQTTLVRRLADAGLFAVTAEVAGVLAARARITASIRQLAKLVQE